MGQYSIAGVFIPKIGNQDINNYMHIHIYDPGQKPVHSDRDHVTAVAFILTGYILSPLLQSIGHSLSTDNTSCQRVVSLVYQ